MTMGVLGLPAGFLLLGAGLAGLAVVVLKGTTAAGQTQTAVTQALTPAPSTGSAPATVNAAVSQVAASKGWGPGEVAAWMGVIAKEDASGSLTATNPSSGAYGIAQGITGPGWYAQYGGDASTLIGQITSMGNYIEQRYGTPTAALAHENSNGWY